MSSIAYIKTGFEHLPVVHESPLVSGLSKLYNNFMLVAQDEENAIATRQSKKELADAGFSYFQLERRESRHIGRYLQKEEHIHAAIRGHIRGVGGALVVATESRIIYLHEIPLYSHLEEFTYDLVSGISLHNISHMLSSVTISTRCSTYELEYVNTLSAEKFIGYVESRLYLRDGSLMPEKERGVYMQ